MLDAQSRAPSRSAAAGDQRARQVLRNQGSIINAGTHRGKRIAEWHRATCRSAAARLRQPRQQRRIKHLAERRRDRDRQDLRQQQAVDAILNDAAAGSGRDDRQPPLLRFDLRHAESVGVRGKHQHVGVTIIIHDVAARHGADSPDARIVQKLPRNRGGHRTDDSQLNRRIGELLERFEQRRHPFEGGDAADEQHA